MVSTPSPSFPLGAVPPMGAGQGTPSHDTSTRGRRPRPRICLRKGCRRKYCPRRWNQRYCQDPQCQREVRRWQAARRQARRRQHAAAKARHAQAEKARRQRAKSAPKPAQRPPVTSARGHAAECFFLRRYATGRAAMRIPRAHLVTPPATAVPPAARPFAMSRTGNASGSPAAPWTGRPNAPSSTRPRGDAAWSPRATPPSRPHRNPIPNDGHPG